MTESTTSKLNYSERLNELYKRLRIAQIAMFRQDRKAIILLEGYDAAGKGGVIRELSYAWDPRGFEVYPIGPPTADELDHPFLWRFWHRIPGRGQIVVFDRSWYGRLLVERVELGLSDAQYESSISEINGFEAMLSKNHITLVKLCLETDRETHRKRLLRRAEHPEKRWKLTESDIQSFKHRHDYENAIDVMCDRCQVAPWHRINMNHKKEGRLLALNTILDALEVHIQPRTFSMNAGVAERLHELSK
jgi:polyphosphate kinase 2 (PPK2 family)